MKTGRTMALVAGALVAGLVLGNVAVGMAATAPSAPASTAAQGPGGMGLRMGGAMREAGGRLVDVVAKLTGLSAEDVQARRQAGESFAAIAKSEGVTSDQVLAQALAVREQVLSERVKSGAMTQAQADAALAAMQTRLTQRVSSTDPGRKGAGGGRGGGRGMGGQGGQGGCGMSGGAGAGACGGGNCGAQAPAATN